MRNGVKIIFVVLAPLIISSCQSTPPHSKRTPSSQITPPLEQGEIWTDRDFEIERQIVEETKRIALENQKPGGLLHRDAHPKHHGCLKAFWSTENSELSRSERFGVFADQAQPLPAWLRLSNGDPKGVEADDAVKDIRGFALKIMGAPNTPLGSQDFVAMTSPQFFSRDSEDYLNLFHALRSGTLSLAWYAARNWRNISLVRAAQVQIKNPLTTHFFTPVPLKYGHQSMRMHFAPCQNTAAQNAKTTKGNPHFLREALVQSLKTEEACFDVLIQRNLDPERNPIENSTLEWDDSVSHWQLAGKVRIPAQQEFNTPAHLAFCENLSFNPWNAHPDLRPLGRINRIRKTVYEEVTKLRHERNGVPQIEPRDHKACAADTAAMCSSR